jgi:hypothetical protein
MEVQQMDFLTEDGYPNLDKCQICGFEWNWPCYETDGFLCPICGQKYRYDETTFIVLSQEQTEILRKHILGSAL